MYMYLVPNYMLVILFSLLFFLKILFMTERGRDTGRERSRLHVGSVMWDSVSGLIMGQRLENTDTAQPKAEAQPLSYPSVLNVPVLKRKIHVELFRG